jgi:hypothetical protein
MQRVPRPRRPILITIAVTVMLALPAGMVLAIHQFTDVPTGSSIHDDVEAIANAGVTTGCTATTYCPNDPVTRGQMAQFMNRLGALSGQDPSVNADRVDGYDAVSFGRAGLRAAADGGVLSWFNRGGGEPTINHEDVGNYRVTIPGKSLNVNQNFVGLATLINAPGSVRVTSQGGDAIVRTYDAAGDPADAQFHLIVFDSAP